VTLPRSHPPRIRWRDRHQARITASRTATAKLWDLRLASAETLLERFDVLAVQAKTRLTQALIRADAAIARARGGEGVPRALRQAAQDEAITLRSQVVAEARELVADMHTLAQKFDVQPRSTRSREHSEALWTPRIDAATGSPLQLLSVMREFLHTRIVQALESGGADIRESAETELRTLNDRLEKIAATYHQPRV
jgi:hypothetical protein